MTKTPKPWTIERRNYSSEPWRLIDDQGEEVMAEVVVEHPMLGRTRTFMPISGATKQQVNAMILAAFVRYRDVLEKRSTALRIIQTWASCDGSSPDTREKAMADIAEKCKEALR